MQSIFLFGEQATLEEEEITFKIMAAYGSSLFFTIKQNYKWYYINVWIDRVRVNTYILVIHWIRLYESDL